MVVAAFVISIFALLASGALALFEWFQWQAKKREQSARLVTGWARRTLGHRIDDIVDVQNLGPSVARVIFVERTIDGKVESQQHLLVAVGAKVRSTFRTDDTTSEAQVVVRWSDDRGDHAVPAKRVP